MLSKTQQPNSFLYIHSDVPTGVGLREWRRELERDRRRRRFHLGVPRVLRLRYAI
jgi:hypothetical protein